MSQSLYEDEQFIILKAKDYVLIRKDSPYSFHSHFKMLGGAKGLLTMFYKGIRPHEDYFRTAMKRVTTEEEFENFTEEHQKPKYVNRQGRR